MLRPLVALLLLCISSLVQAQSAGSLQAVYTLRAAGAAQLALHQIEQVQPGSSAPDWAEWESLRLVLLTDLGRYSDVLKRVAMLPEAAPERLRQQAWGYAASAAIQIKDGATARKYLQRLLWQFDLDDREQRQARWMVVESYLVQGRSADAYHVMLRYQQDFHTLEQERLRRVVRVLLENGMAHEAVTWMPDLADGTALKRLVKLKAGLIAPQTVVAESREALRQDDRLEHWRVLLEAARMMGDIGLQAEASEQLLNGQLIGTEGEIAVTPTQLWRLYDQYAQSLGNSAQLLVGDDEAWLGLAVSLLKTNPAGARAILSRLSLSAGNPGVRQRAQMELVSSLASHDLQPLAVRLFKAQDRVKDGAQMAAQVRYILGDLAYRVGDYPYAASLWNDLDSSFATSSPEEWRLLRASAWVKGGGADKAAQLLSGLTLQPGVLTPAGIEIGASVAEGLQTAGQDAAAQGLFAQLLALAPPEKGREMLMVLGKSAEARRQYSVASEYYLRAAVALDGKRVDPVALQAYYAAAENLGRAGYEQDAKQVYRRIRLIRELPGKAAENIPSR
jgi:hypothetical protein